jgi:hypothetical protein
MRACLTGDLDISKSITRAIALWVHLGFAAEYQGLGGGMLTAEGAAVAKIVVLRSNSRSVRLVNHRLNRIIVKPATILVPLSDRDSSSLHLRLILVA